MDCQKPDHVAFFICFHHGHPLFLSSIGNKKDESETRAKTPRLWKGHCHSEIREVETKIRYFFFYILTRWKTEEREISHGVLYDYV